MATLISRQRPLPDFITVRADLQLEEGNMKARPPSQALIAGSQTTPAPSAPRPTVPSIGSTPCPPAPHNGGGNSNGGNVRPNFRGGRNNRRNGGYGGYNGGNGYGCGNNNRPDTGGGVPTFNPLTGTFQVWPGYVPGVLGSRPRPPLPQHTGQLGIALTTLRAPPSFGTPAAPPGFDAPSTPPRFGASYGAPAFGAPATCAFCYYHS